MPEPSCADARLVALERASVTPASLANFIRPRFRFADVAAALDVPSDTLRSWQARGQIRLDADNGRAPEKWREYSARDVLRLGIAVRLASCGIAASRLMATIDLIESFFPLSPNNRLLAANRTVSILVTPAGEVSGPEVGSAIDLDDGPRSVFFVLRMDLLVRETLERLGVTLTHGNGADMRAAAARLEAASATAAD